MNITGTISVEGTSQAVTIELTPDEFKDSIDSIKTFFSGNVVVDVTAPTVSNDGPDDGRFDVLTPALDNVNAAFASGGTGESLVPTNGSSQI